MKKLAVQLIKELTSLTDAIPAGFKGLFAKNSGLFWKNSDGTEQKILAGDSIGDLNVNSYSSVKSLLVTSSNANELLFANKKYTIVATANGTPVDVSAMFDGKSDSAFFANVSTHVPLVIEITGMISMHPSFHTLFLLGWRDAAYSSINNNGATLINYTIEKKIISTGLWELVIDYSNVAHTLPRYWGLGSANYFNGIRITINEMLPLNYVGAYLTELGIKSTAGTPPWEAVGAISKGGGTVYGDLTGISKFISNEIINFDTNIEPTQTGTSVVKTSTWMWQYLAQGIKWLRANFSNYSLTTHNHNLASLAEKNYSSLSNIPTTFTPSAHNHALASLSEKSYNSLTDKPTIPAAQVQTDWNATTGLGVLLNKPASLPANGGNADTVGSKHAYDFAKVDTAFTSFGNIAGNNADCAVFVIDTSSRWISNAIHEILANNITLPSGTSSMVLILQPGIYKIASGIDFASYNVRAIIGLCPDSTIINLEDTTGHIMNGELI